MSDEQLEKLIEEAYEIAETKYPKNEGQGYFERLLIEAVVEMMEKRSAMPPLTESGR